MPVYKAGQTQQTENQQNEFNKSSTTTSSYNIPTFGLVNKLSILESAGDYYEKIYNHIKNKVKYLNEEVKTEERYEVIKLPKNYGLNYAGIIVSSTLNNVTAAHVIMIEKTGNYPEKLVENISNIRYEFIRTPADALDDRYVSQAISVLSETLSVDPNSIVITDGTLVPNEFDPNNEALLNSLLINTINSINAELSLRVKDYKGINLYEFIQNNRNGKFFINLYFNDSKDDVFDCTGMPIRQDICVSLSYKLNNTNNKSVNQLNESIEIVKVYGYVDFEWSPVVTNNVMNTQKFIPNFIITHIESKFTITPDILFMGIMTVFAINEDSNWLQAFRPVPTKKNEIDFNDIGALNIEGNIEANQTGFGKKLDIKRKDFTLVDLYNFVNRLVRPNLIVSIDVPKAAPTTWFTSVLAYIYRNSRDAYRRVHDYLNTLTNGNFQSNNIAIFDSLSNKIHGGFFKTASGQFKDIRHLSCYLAFANFINDTNQSPALITQYTNTLYNLSIPNELRCSERKKYIDEMSNHTAVYKQYYDRFLFSSAFLVNLLNSLKAIGFSPLLGNVSINNDIFQRRSHVDFTQSMLGQDARIITSNNWYTNSWFNNPYGYNRQY